MELRVEPMSDVLGARVTGIDLRDGLDDATFAELRRIWLDHLVILLPGQDISSEQQAAFATGFGVLTTPRDSPPQSDDQPNSLLITNVKDTGMRTALEKDSMLFHTDGAYFEKPCLAHCSIPSRHPRSAARRSWPTVTTPMTRCRMK